MVSTRGIHSYFPSRETERWIIAGVIGIAIVAAIFAISLTACATSSPRISYDLEEAIALKGIGQDQIGRLFDFVDKLYAEGRAPTGKEVGYWKSKREDLLWLVTYITSRVEVHEGQDWSRIVSLILKIAMP